MAIAEALGWDEDQVLAMSPEKYARWLAYFKVKASEEERQINKAKKKAAMKKPVRSGGRGRR